MRTMLKTKIISARADIEDEEVVDDDDRWSDTSK
jgi:hypothetical protein